MGALLPPLSPRPAPPLKGMPGYRRVVRGWASKTKQVTLATECKGLKLNSPSPLFIAETYLHTRLERGNFGNTIQFIIYSPKEFTNLIYNGGNVYIEKYRGLYWKKSTFSNVITLSLLPGREMKSEYDNIAEGMVPVAHPARQQC